MTDAVLVTGPLASGKTRVAVEAGRLLEAAGVPYAVIDLDWLCWAGPDRADLPDLLADNLGTVAARYARAGIHHLVLARTVTTATDRDALRAALGPGARLTTVGLQVPDEVTRQRLLDRGDPDDLAEYPALAAATTLQPDATVPNDGDPRTAARAVLAVTGWLDGRPEDA